MSNLLAAYQAIAKDDELVKLILQAETDAPGETYSSRGEKLDNLEFRLSDIEYDFKLPEGTLQLDQLIEEFKD